MFLSEGEMSQKKVNAEEKMKHCFLCNEFNFCFYVAYGHDLFPAAVPKYYNYTRQRDLCLHNDKYLWEKKEGENVAKRDKDPERSASLHHGTRSGQSKQ